MDSLDGGEPPHGQVELGTIDASDPRELLAIDRRRRRAFWISLGAIGVCLATLAITVLPSLSSTVAGQVNDPDSPSASATPTTTGPTTSTNLVIPKQFDPAVQYGAFGWLPDGMRDTMVTVTGAQFMVGNYYDASGLNRGPGVELTLFPHGSGSESPSLAGSPSPSLAGSPSPSLAGSPSPSLAGSPSPSPTDRPSTERYIVNGSSVDVYWLYAPGARASLRLSGLRPGSGDPLTVALRVVDSLRYSVSALTPLPVRPTAIPPVLPQLSLYLARVASGRPFRWTMRLEFSDTPTEVDPVDQTFRALVVEANYSTATTGDGKKVPQPNTVVDGHTARYEVSQYSQALYLFDVQSAYIRVWTSGPSLTSLLPGGVTGVYHNLRIHTATADWN
jgi:hypothetical protein